MKRGVVVDAFASGSLFAPEFKKKGFEMIHVRTTKTPTVAYINAPFNRGDFVLDIYEPDKEKLLLILKDKEIQFVVVGAEGSSELADFLSENLHVPTNGTSKSGARRDKFEMVELVAKAGLKTAKQIKTSSVLEAIDFAKKLPKFHVVLKPLRSAGTELVSIVNDEEDLKAGFEKIINSKTQFNEENTKVCVQEFMIGDEYAVDTVSCNGKTVVTDIWKYHLTDANGVKDFYDYHELVSPSNPRMALLNEYTVKVAKALGIKWGPNHPEIMLTKEGPKIIETNARLAGSGLPKLATVGLGQSQIELTVAAYTNPRKFDELSKRKAILSKNCFWVNLISHQEGILKNLDKFSEIEKLQSFYSKVIEVNVGEKIKKTVDLTTTPGFVFLVNEDKNQIMNDYNFIRDIENNGLYEV